MARKNIIRVILFFVFTFAFFIRVYHLTMIPPGLNRDETAIGYTAYSLLRSGSDEYGKHYPISFRSFGDWKLPFYIYLTIPFVKIFGLTEFATRFPSAFLGSITVVLVYILTRQLLLVQQKISDTSISLVALFASFFLAINPWHVYMSRNASESNSAVFLVTLSLVLFFESFKRHVLLLFSFFLLSLSVYTYHGNHIFTPLLFFGIIFFFRSQVKMNKWFIFSCALFLINTSFIYSQTLFVADRTKIAGLFPLSDEFQLHDAVEMRLAEHTQHNSLDKLLHNKAVFLSTTVVNNFVRSFSPEFLFIKGGANTQHNIPDFGNLYSWAVIGIIGALYWFLKERKRWMLFLCYWLLISAVAPSITKDAPHTNRMMPFLPLPDILTSLGLYFVFMFFKNKHVKRFFTLGISLVAIFYAALFFDRYFIHFPIQRAHVWGGAYKELIAKLSIYEKSGKSIIMERPHESPYIYFLFYKHYDPEQFISEVERYPDTIDGFSHVKSFGQYTFEHIDWKTAVLKPGFVYVDWVEGVPWEATNSSILIGTKELALINEQNPENSIERGVTVKSELKETISQQNGKPLWYIIETSKE